MPVAVTDNIGPEKVLQCVDTGLDAFGPTVKDVIYFRLKVLYGLERSDIVKKPDVLTECMRNFFGERSFHVEQSIVGSIMGGFHLTEVNLSDSMTRAIVEARKQLQTSN
jgi:hypothetical protein